MKIIRPLRMGLLTRRRALDGIQLEICQHVQSLPVSGKLPAATHPAPCCRKILPFWQLTL